MWISISQAMVPLSHSLKLLSSVCLHLTVSANISLPLYNSQRMQPQNLSFLEMHCIFILTAQPEIIHLNDSFHSLYSVVTSWDNFHSMLWILVNRLSLCATITNLLIVSLSLAIFFLLHLSNHMRRQFAMEVCSPILSVL